MMRTIRASALPRRPPRPPVPGDIRDIVEQVRSRGDEALLEYERRFGTGGPLRMEHTDIRAAYDMVSLSVRDAISHMARRLRRTEEALRGALEHIRGQEGVDIRFVPIPSVGCYVPGGQARYPSSAVMSVVPAAVAGVERIVVASPPGQMGPDPATLVAADMCGAGEIYAMGGAQAIAALAYGTDTIEPVDKIVGPGGAAVTAAKRIVSADVPIDMEAGPTELGILADSDADPHLVALDLVSQAEHSADTLCFLVTDSADLARQVNDHLIRYTKQIPRSGMVLSSLQNNGFIVVCDDMAQAVDISNQMAPEHLQVMTGNPEHDAEGIRAAGLVLLGEGTPSAASDYLLGSNHILPTGGQGRVRGQLSVLDYITAQTRIRAAPGDLGDIIAHMKSITDSEGLPNHYRAARGRLP